MSYFPKSQTKQNLYTKGGELYYTTNNTEYKGYYYTTSKNGFFTGKYPGDLPNDSLTKAPPEGAEDFDPNNIPTQNQTTWVYQGSGYNKDFQSSSTLPTSIYPSPSEKDYKLGEFQRYFVSKVNGVKFIEVSELVYNQYLNQDPNVSYQLYFPFKLSWELTGNREKVYKVNLSTVQRIENNLQLRGFTQYFKNRFDQFYKELG